MLFSKQVVLKGVTLHVYLISDSLRIHMFNLDICCHPSMRRARDTKSQVQLLINSAHI